MTLFYRSALLALLVTTISGCDPLYMDQPRQPAPRPIYDNPQPVPQPPVSPIVYPQPSPPPIPQPVPTPPTVQQKVVTAPNAAPAPVASPTAQPPAYNEDESHGKVIPVRPPNSISQLPDPS